MYYRAYTFGFATQCPTCTTEALIKKHLVPAEAREVPTEEARKEAARRKGVDISDLSRYDSRDIPKPIEDASLGECFLCTEDLPHRNCFPEPCDRCGEIL